MERLRRLHVDSTGRLRPADGDTTTKIHYNKPFPTPKGRYGSGKIRGVVMHTMVTNLPQCIMIFNEPHPAQASAHFGIAQDGRIHQFGPIGKGWIAWAQSLGNSEWYSIEHADDGDQHNPLTQKQMDASAQVVECLSKFAGFPLKTTDSIQGRGYGTHAMGGAGWGGHSCPGPGPRANQRWRIIWRAGRIRLGLGIRHP